MITKKLQKMVNSNCSIGKLIKSIICIAACFINAQ